MINILKHNIESIEKVCKRRQVKHLYTFGSVNSSEFSDKSDIDFLVDFGDADILELADLYLDLCYDLEALLGVKVDLVTTNSIKNPIFRKALDESKQLIYSN